MTEPMAQDDIDHFINTATEILEAVKEGLIVNGITPPERSYVTIATEEETVHDDADQLTVAFGLMTPHYPEGQIPRARGQLNTRIGTFYIELVRCTPRMISTKGGTKKIAPPIEKMREYGKQRLQEVAVLKDVCNELLDTPYDPLGRGMYTIAAGLDQGQAQAIKVTLQTMV